MTKSYNINQNKENEKKKDQAMIKKGGKGWGKKGGMGQRESRQKHDCIPRGVW